jgi:hypothetical protein
MTKLNYQQIYEDQLTPNLKESLEMPDRFYELSHQQRLMIEELVDIGQQSAIEEALNPEILNETVALAAELGGQLYNFANMLSVHLGAEEEGNQGE